MIIVAMNKNIILNNKPLQLLVVFLLFFLSSVHAQLGTPTTTVKDTFYFSSVYYNGTELNRADWPDSMIVEDALNIYISNYVYKKGKLISHYGNEYRYTANCNGKTSDIKIIRNYGGSVKYTIDDYAFLINNEMAENRGSLSSGNGTIDKYETRNSGSGYSLNGRKASALPTPNYDRAKEGKVIVKIWVDRNGDVVKVEAPQRGSTITDVGMIRQSEAAARKAKFNADPNAAEQQVGTITYVFRRNN